ncbi:hypothetical protein ACQ4PT_006873 [Festuca glaucescens]
MKRWSPSVERDGAAADDGKQSAERSAIARPSGIVYVVLLATMLWAVIFFLHDFTSLQLGNVAFFSHLKKFQLGLWDKCAGRYVYMYELPPPFNADLIRDCRQVMCKHMANGGFGAPITEGGGALPERGAYDTDQFMLALIFHARMKQHECLTSDPAAAAAVYIPFYAGLDAERYLGQEDPDVSAIDALSRDLVEWLLRRPEWRAMGGRDHFLVAGRTTWDLLREPGFTGRGGSSLMTFPAIRNPTVLAVEASSWHGIDFGVPYPSHFHFSDADVTSWQGRMRRAERRVCSCESAERKMKMELQGAAPTERKWLWGFAGASRPSSKKTVRSQIIEQCGRSSRCAMFGRSTAAYTPGQTMHLLESAEFCVQPRGDSFTRKSTFDSILAGCIPVFFHPVSAYLQYIWYLPRGSGRS